MKKPNHNHDRMYRENERMHPMMRNRSYMRKQLLHKNSFKEMQTLILLTKIKNETEGISGYQLREHFDLPRGTLLRMLSSLEQKKSIETREEVINGRANKFYSITKDGEEFLEELKMKWADRNAEIDELAPFENYGMRNFQREDHRRRPMHSPRNGRANGKSHPRNGHFPEPLGGPSRVSHHYSHRPEMHLARDDILEILINRIDTFKSKEEAIDFLKGHRSRLNGSINRLESRVQEAKKARQEIDELVSTIEKLNEFTGEQLERLFTDPPTK
ncbi:MAG: PadR family transcriptional regulator [Promethearchaeota archaeon]